MVYGNSGGGIILASLAMRRPDVLRGAFFHEPAYLAATSNAGEVGAGLEQLVGAGMAEGGPPRATELFLRLAAGDEVYESFAPDLRARMLGNGEVLFGLEMEQFLTASPTAEQLAGVDVPVVVAAGADNRDPAVTLHWLYEASQWFADGVGVRLVETPGAHVPQVSHPQALVEMLRPILAGLAASSRVEA